MNESTRDATIDLMNENARLRAALGALLDAVDYTSGACLVIDMVGAALDPVLIQHARKALERE